ncbi:FmdB family zinc ribbon protein [Chloroflexota bacterium]
MPIYEYECNRCKHHFDEMQGFSDNPEASCPECQGESRRCIFPAPIIYKTGGFYITDVAKKSVGGSSAASESAGSGGK